MIRVRATAACRVSSSRAPYAAAPAIAPRAAGAQSQPCPAPRRSRLVVMGAFNQTRQPQRRANTGSVEGGRRPRDRLVRTDDRTRTSYSCAHLRGGPSWGHDHLHPAEGTARPPSRRDRGPARLAASRARRLAGRRHRRRRARPPPSPAATAPSRRPGASRSAASSSRSGRSSSASASSGWSPPTSTSCRRCSASSSWPPSGWPSSSAAELAAPRLTPAVLGALRLLAALAFGATIFQAAQSLQVPAYEPVLLGLLVGRHPPARLPDPRGDAPAGRHRHRPRLVDLAAPGRRRAAAPVRCSRSARRRCWPCRWPSCTTAGWTRLRRPSGAPSAARWPWSPCSPRPSPTRPPTASSGTCGSSSAWSPPAGRGRRGAGPRPRHRPLRAARGARRPRRSRS